MKINIFYKIQAPLEPQITSRAVPVMLKFLEMINFQIIYFSRFLNFYVKETSQVTGGISTMVGTNDGSVVSYSSILTYALYEKYAVVSRANTLGG